MAFESIPFSSGGNIQEILYDIDSQTLHVVFAKGSYEYSPVDATQAEGFAEHPSATAYLRSMIEPQTMKTRVS